MGTVGCQPTVLLDLKIDEPMSLLVRSSRGGCLTCSVFLPKSAPLKRVSNATYEVLPGSGCAHDLFCEVGGPDRRWIGCLSCAAEVPDCCTAAGVGSLALEGQEFCLGLCRSRIDHRAARSESICASGVWLWLGTLRRFMTRVPDPRSFDVL